VVADIIVEGNARVIFDVDGLVRHIDALTHSGASPNEVLLAIHQYTEHVWYRISIDSGWPDLTGVVQETHIIGKERMAKEIVSRLHIDKKETW
jgi:hypothetical protein